MKRHLFHPAARQELHDAAEYYERQREGRGRAFLREIDAALQLVRTFPHTWPKLSESTRRCRTRRFPYALIYRVEEDAVEIVSVMHLHQHPDTWKGR